MYFLVSLGAALISGLLLFLFKDRKKLHLEILTIIFGAAALMWLIDCIFSAAKGEGFLSFEELDGWISLATIGSGVFLWLIVAFILNNNQKTE